MELLIYSPNRPVVDYSVVFLWMMSVGTVVSATLWSDIVGSEEYDEPSNQLSPKVLCKKILVFTLCIHSNYRPILLLYLLNLITKLIICIICQSPYQESDAGADKDDAILHITTISAVVFVISASTFLLLLYFFMSASFVWVLIVLFCLGGVEVRIHFNHSSHYCQF